MGSWGRLAVVLAVQLGILAAVPARQVAARLWGKAVTLKTGPVDPYDILAGRYVTLSYEVEQVTMDRAETGLRPDEDVWLTVRRDEPAWRLESVTRARPAPAPDRASIRARWRWSSGASGGLEIAGAKRFYFGDERAAIPRWQRDQVLVDLRVGGDGTPAVVGLRSGGTELRPR